MSKKFNLYVQYYIVTYIFNAVVDVLISRTGALSLETLISTSYISDFAKNLVSEADIDYKESFFSSLDKLKTYTSGNYVEYLNNDFDFINLLLLLLFKNESNIQEIFPVLLQKYDQMVPYTSVEDFLINMLKSLFILFVYLKYKYLLLNYKKKMAEIYLSSALS